MDLRLIVLYWGETAIIACVGRLVYGEEAASLRARVKGLIAQGAKSIFLDLAGVTYVDSRARGTYWAAYERAAGELPFSTG